MATPTRNGGTNGAANKGNKFADAGAPRAVSSAPWAARSSPRSTSP